MRAALLSFTLLAASSAPLSADSLFINTGNVDGRMAMASRPDANGKQEIEAADDFLLTTPAIITSATFTGLLPSGATVTSVTAEIYRVFPKDSQNPPSGAVPTRTNSPSDVAFQTRTSGPELTFSTSILNASFTAANSVLNGINPAPNQQTGGEGAVTGQEVEFSLSFSDPFRLPADHYFFIPQVELSNGDFFWLSSVRPIVSPGTPFSPDLQAWIRNADLDPNWLRVGTDIVGGNPAPTFNGAFSLSGQVAPEPSTLLLFAGGMAAFYAVTRKNRRSRS